MRRTRTDFLFAILLASFTSFLYQANACTAALLTLTVFCTFTVGSLRHFLMLWLSAGILALYFIFGQQQLANQAKRPAFIDEMAIRVQRDQLRLTTEGTVSGQGRLESGEKVLFNYQATSQKDLDRFIESDHARWLLGQGEKRPIMGPTNDYQFDFRRYWQSQKVTHQIQLKTVAMQEAKASNPVVALIDFLHRAHFRAERLAERLPNPLRDYALSLLLASKASQLYQNNPMIAELGLLHLFALSGLHVAFLTATVQRFFRYLRIEQEVGDGVLLVLLPLFYLFTSSPAVLFRALLAGELRIIRRYLRWRISAIQIWSYSLIGSLLLSPAILLTLGGQLSFSLTLAVILSKQLGMIKRGLFLSLVTFPLILSQQYVWNGWQTVANLLAIPFFTSAVLPATLLGYFLGSWSFLATLCNLLIRFFDTAVSLAGRLPGQFVIGALSWPVLIGLFLLPFWLLPLGKTGKRLVIAAWFTILLGNFVLIHWPAEGEWTTFDIGQGDAAVLIEPRHRTVTMIDTGGKVRFGPQPNYRTGHPEDLRPKAIEAKKAKARGGAGSFRYFALSSRQGNSTHSYPRALPSRSGPYWR
ncbi:ComEC/Rec2 family competence protein [Fructobacillus parabroussonetiae]|uniref:ComEC/Rec2-related protein domain-containing protein n=1 Tax=Fructobacillus parabroussonetiae TaxID=2713174 RepID=A0ABS5QX37_9LACO|nr:ComEC/Rec2 family competence protein [Fructobacillus parabroussonetiae]MBS9337765.1 hypothetical protein [Fructobacillus parabroussonetiae]